MSEAMNETQARRRLAELHGKRCCEVCDVEREHLIARRTDFGIFELCDGCYEAIYGTKAYDEAISPRMGGGWWGAAAQLAVTMQRRAQEAEKAKPEPSEYVKRMRASDEAFERFENANFSGYQSYLPWSKGRLPKR